MGSINSLRGCDQKEQLPKKRRSACRSCWRRFYHGLARSGWRWSWFCYYIDAWWLLLLTTMKMGGVVGCLLEDGSFLCLWWGVACCELKGRAWFYGGYVLHCSLCKSEQWKHKNTKRWMRSMKIMLHQNPIFLVGLMNQTTTLFYNQTLYYWVWIKI